MKPLLRELSTNNPLPFTFIRNIQNTERITAFMFERFGGGMNARYVHRNISSGIKNVYIRNYNSQNQKDGYVVIKNYSVGSTPTIREFKDGKEVRKLTEPEIKAFGIPEKLKE